MHDWQVVVYNLFSGVYTYTRSFCPRVWPPPLSSITSGVFAPGASILGYSLPPIEFSMLSSIEYIISSQEFLHQEICPRIWPPPPEFSMLSSIISGVSAPGSSVPGYSLLPPHRTFYTVIYIVYNLFSGVSTPGASVLGYGFPPPRIFYAVVYNLRSFCTRIFCPRV